VGVLILDLPGSQVVGHLGQDLVEDVVRVVTSIKPIGKLRLDRSRRLAVDEAWLGYESRLPFP
jgi:hypothetical protein